MAPPKVEFKGRVVHTNTPVTPAKEWGISVPQGLTADDVRMPNFVTPEQMYQLVNDLPHISNSGIGIVHGVVKPQFALVFPDMANQWKKSVSQANFATWQFQGGEVILEVTITVHILASSKPPEGDALKRKRFAIIWEHELLHVLDEATIVRDWLPKQVTSDEMVKKFLIDAVPTPDSSFNHWITSGNLSTWVRDGLWVGEHNRHASIRDSPAEYKEISDKVNEIDRRIINRP